MRRHRHMLPAGLVAAASILLTACSGGGSTTTTTTTSPSPTTSATSTTSTTSTVVVTTTTSTTSTTTSSTTTTSTTTSPTTTSTSSTTSSPPPTPPSGPSAVVRLLPEPAVEQRLVALTLDAGSDLGYTHAILDTLADRGVLASFGITGTFAEEHPDAIRRMAAEGHHVINHTHSHRSYTGVSSTQVFLTAAERQADLERAEAVLEPLAGATTRPFWRPPFGDYDAGVLADVGATGWGVTVMWSIDTLGWQGLSADEILGRVIERVEPGAIVLMHVGSASQDGPVLGRMIDELRALGYGFTTVRAAWEASAASAAGGL